MKMSPNQLAERCNLAAATVYRLESDDFRQLRSDALRDLADVLRTTADFLLGRVSDTQIGDAISSDQNLNYLVKLYSEMNVRQVQQLVKYAEFLRYRLYRVKELMEEFAGLYHFTLDSMEKNHWDNGDERFQKANKRMADIAINRSLEEADLDKASDTRS